MVPLADGEDPRKHKLGRVQTSLQKVWSSPLCSRGVGSFGQQGDGLDCLANNR